MSLHSWNSSPLDENKYAQFLMEQQHWKSAQVYNDMYRKKIKLPKNSILVVDLLIEGFGISKGKNGFYTNSDFHREYLAQYSKLDGSVQSNEAAFLRGSKFDNRLWEEACCKFKEFTDDLGITVILHECYFATHYIDKGRLRRWPEGKSRIKKINENFKHYNEVFTEIVKPEIKIKVNDEYRVASLQHQWGAFVTHYIDDYYQNFMEQFKSYFHYIESTQIQNQTFVKIANSQ